MYLRLLLSFSALLLSLNAVGGPLIQSRILYMSGGIGKDEQALMRKYAKDFNLQLAFSEFKDSEFVAGEELLIKDARGDTVFALPSAGPLVNLRLPAGRYTVSASYKGASEAHDVTLEPHGAKTISFRWRANLPARGPST